MQFIRYALRAATGFLVAFPLALFAVAAVGQEQADSPLNDLDWVIGPTTVGITHRAKIDLPDGYDYLDPQNTKVLMELMENPSSDSEYYVGPTDMHWFAVLSYEETGYIRDNEEIEPGPLLESIREGTEISNRERRERGWSEMQILGWKYEPFYEKETNRLAWAIRGASEGSEVINYNTRLLGRSGVMSAVLVADPETLDTSVEEFKELLEHFSYRSGHTYAEYREGDKVAAYGLAALVAGGTAAAVAKGAGKGFFKIILAGGAALLAAIGGAVRRFFGGKRS